MSIYDTLKKNKKISYKNSKEYIYFEENKKIISKVKNNFCFSKNNEFNLITANILIKAFKTKNSIYDLITENLNEEDAVKKISAYLKTRPYVLLNDNTRCYLPQFSNALNIIYTQHPFNLNKYPYDKLKFEADYLIIDSFDQYGYKLYDSSFTNLEFIINDNTSAAFYSPSFEAVFVINNQGSLDSVIYLFDKHLAKKNKDNLKERLKIVMANYYENKLILFIDSLYEQEFISQNLKDKIRKKTLKRIVKRNKKVGFKNENI